MNIRPMIIIMVCFLFRISEATTKSDINTAVDNKPNFCSPLKGFLENTATNAEKQMRVKKQISKNKCEEEATAAKKASTTKKTNNKSKFEVYRPSCDLWNFDPTSKLYALLNLNDNGSKYVNVTCILSYINGHEALIDTIYKNTKTTANKEGNGYNIDYGLNTKDLENFTKRFKQCLQSVFFDGKIFVGMFRPETGFIKFLPELPAGTEFDRKLPITSIKYLGKKTFGISDFSCSRDKFAEQELHFSEDSKMIRNHTNFLSGTSRLYLKFKIKNIPTTLITATEKTSGEGDIFEVMIPKPNLLLVVLQTRNQYFEMTVELKPNEIFNDSNWHEFYFEKNSNYFTTTADGIQINSKLNVPNCPSMIFNQYTIGGAKGFAGCIRSLSVNGILLDTKPTKEELKQGITEKCPGKCALNYCISDEVFLENFNSKYDVGVGENYETNSQDSTTQQIDIEMSSTDKIEVSSNFEPDWETTVSSNNDPDHEVTEFTNSSNEVDAAEENKPFVIELGLIITLAIIAVSVVTYTIIVVFCVCLYMRQNNRKNELPSNNEFSDYMDEVVQLLTLKRLEKECAAEDDPEVFQPAKKTDDGKLTQDST